MCLRNWCAFASAGVAIALLTGFASSSLAGEDAPPAAPTAQQQPAPAGEPAGPPPAPRPVFDGPFCERPKLTGDWCDVRNSLAECGVTIDTSLTQFYQGVTSGGREWQYGGKLDYLLNVDGQKAGLWQGLFINMHAETRYGRDVNGIDGLIAPSNIAMFFPRPEEDLTAITGLKVTQALSENFAVFGGKINTLDDYRINYAGGKGIDGFMNSSFVFNPISGRTIPYSAIGGGFAVLRNLKPVLAFTLLDPVDTATTFGVNQFLDHGVVLAGEAHLPVNFLDRPGHQIFGGSWSSKRYTELDRESFLLIPRDGIVAGTKQGSWNLWYNFDQALWVDSCNPKRTWGLFGQSGISDGNPNPVRWTMNGGIGGASPLASRPNDTFGIGYYYLGLSHDFKNLFNGPLLGRALAQRDEHGLEIFYNVAVTPWCHITSDFQAVEPSTRALDTAVIFGVRAKLDF